MTARLSGLEDAAHWIACAGDRGARRFELWVKVRGFEQERALVSSSAEPLDVADEFLTRVDHDRRVEAGHATYVILAYDEKSHGPVERAFVAPSPRAMPVTALMGGAPNEMQPHPGSNPSAALVDMFSTLNQQTRELFGVLQRENEHQRRANEALTKASTGYFETFAKGYERTFMELQSRLDASFKEAASARAEVAATRLRNDELELQHKRLRQELEALASSKDIEKQAAEAHQKRLDTVVATLQQLFPMIVAKFEGFGSKDAAARETALGKVLRELTAEQQQTMLSALTPEQRTVVFDYLRGAQQQQAGSSVAQAVVAAVTGTAGGGAAPGSPAPPPPATSPPSAAAGAPAASPPSASASAVAAPNSPSASPIAASDESAFKIAFDVLTSRGAQFDAWVNTSFKVAPDEGAGTEGVPFGTWSAKRNADAAAANVPPGATSAPANDGSTTAGEGATPSDGSRG